MRKHNIELSERELRDILTAFDFAAEGTEKQKDWFFLDRIQKLYYRLRDL